MPTNDVAVRIEQWTYPAGLNNTETRAYRAYAMDAFGVWIEEAPPRDTYEQAEDDAAALREKYGVRRPVGRPRVHHEPRRKVTLMLPEADVAAIEARGAEVTAFVVAAIRVELERESGG